MDNQTKKARGLRVSQTRSEGLLWSILRGRQLCGLKFRRQHPIGPYFADFACVGKKLVIEIDGGYHDYTPEADLRRESFIRDEGWDIIRFNAEEVEEDAEVAARGIARHLGLRYNFQRRKGTGAGMLTTKQNPSPPSRKRDGDPPQGG